MDQKLWGKKCNFWQFRGILTPFDPWGQTRIFIKNPRMSVFYLSKSTNSLDISEKLNGRLLRYAGGTDKRMNEPTGPKTIVPLKILEDKN